MAGARLASVGTVISLPPGFVVAHGEWQQDKANDKIFILSLTLQNSRVLELLIHAIISVQAQEERGAVDRFFGHPKMG